MVYRAPLQVTLVDTTQALGARKTGRRGFLGYVNNGGGNSISIIMFLGGSMAASICRQNSSGQPAGDAHALTGHASTLCLRRHTTVIITVDATSLSRAPHKGCVRATMVRVSSINRRARVKPTADHRRRDDNDVGPH